MAIKERHPKKITDKKDIDEIAHLKASDLTQSYLLELFGEYDSGQRFQPYDEIEIPANSYGIEGYQNKKPIYTTVGIYVFNKYFIEEKYLKIIGYINKTVNKKEFGKIIDKLTQSLLEKEISVDDFDYFSNRTEKMMPLSTVICPALSEEILISSVKAQKKIQELYKTKYKERIDNHDGLATSELEAEVLDYMKEELKGDPGLDCYDSGARGSWGNNYKNMFVMKGAVKDPETGKFNILMDSYANGIKKEDYAALSNSLAAGPFARARMTAFGGYKEKLFVSAFQHVKLDPPGSDCGSNLTIPIELTEKNINDYMYNYIIEHGENIEITSKNKDKYIGKTVNMRFANLCKSKTGYCNHCVGNLLYRIGGMSNIGMAMSIIPDKIKLIQMKKFHDSVSSYHKIDLNKMFGK